jgi:hypothetical protein
MDVNVKNINKKLMLPLIFNKKLMLPLIFNKKLKTEYFDVLIITLYYQQINECTTS